MPRYLAEWVLPMTGPPIRRGWIDVAQGRVASVGSGAARDTGAPVVNLGAAAILPALVNAHTHLELSGLRGDVPPAGSMPAWVDRLLARRGESGGPDPGAMRQAVAESRAFGTGLLGDISNTLASVAILESAGADARVFREVLAFPDEGAEAVVSAAVEETRACSGLTSVRLGWAAHAPYSVGPAAFAALDRVIRRGPAAPRRRALARPPGAHRSVESRMDATRVWAGRVSGADGLAGPGAPCRARRAVDRSRTGPFG